MCDVKPYSLTVHAQCWCATAEAMEVKGHSVCQNSSSLQPYILSASFCTFSLPILSFPLIVSFPTKGSGNLLNDSLSGNEETTALST